MILNNSSQYSVFSSQYSINKSQITNLKKMKKTILTIFVASTTLLACNNSYEKPSCGSEGHTCTSECAAKEEAEPISTTEESTTETTTEEEALADTLVTNFVKKELVIMLTAKKGMFVVKNAYKK